MKRWFSEKRNLSPFVLALAILTFPWASQPVFGDIFPYERSAKPLGKSNLELMSNYSARITSVFAETDHYSNQYGIQVGYGLGQNFDLQFRYGLTQYIDNSGRLHHQFTLGPKRAMLNDRLAIHLPVSFIFTSDYVRTSGSWELFPTLSFTQKIEQISELNGSITALIPLNRRLDRDAVFVALNLGMGLYLIPDKVALLSEIHLLKKLSRLGRPGSSTTHVRIESKINFTDKWALRPEMGLGVGNWLSHFGVGITYYP